MLPARISRRRLVRAMPALLAVGLLSAACQSAAPAATSAPATRPTDAPKPTTAPAAASPAAAAASSPVASSAAASPAASPAAAASPSPAAAASSSGSSATFDKADVDAAKKDGAVVWYTSTPLRQAQVVADAFENKYGFKVEVFRTGGEQVIQRFQTELSAGKTAVDLLTASDPAAFDEMVKKSQLVKFRPEHSDKVPAAAVNPDGFWVAQRLNLTVMAYRDDKEDAAQMPKKWGDVIDPKASTDATCPARAA